MINLKRKFNKLVRTSKEAGIQGVIQLFYNKVKARKYSYSKWLKGNRVKAEELNLQRKHVFAYKPLISVVIPLFKTQKWFLEKVIESVRNQTYSNWEICFSDGSGEETELREVVSRYMNQDSRIKMIISEKEPLQISENTNQAISIAEGEFIAFMDHDDCLAENALYEVVSVLNEMPDMDYIYSDEDKVSMDGRKYFDPHFKPDFNEFYLCTGNYITHLSVIRSSLVKELGGLHSEYDGAQDFDLALRCIEKTKKVYHIPKVLYHWRVHMDSTAGNPESKLYAYAAGAKAVEDHYKREGINAIVTQQTEGGRIYGLYSTEYILEETPLISIIIPNKDHIEDLQKCLDSIEQVNIYRNFEVIIVENNSTEEETFLYYEKLKEKENYNVVEWSGEFNYSAINNFGASYAKGDYFLLLNNDVEVINRKSFEQMLAVCLQEEVGIVGARLFYPDNTLQHGGVIVGFGKTAVHMGTGMSEEDFGYYARPIRMQELSAVTAACMMIKRSVFEEVDGFDECLGVAFNDIDLCLSVRKVNKKVVYLPTALLYHYESKSRGYEDTPEKVKRHDEEASYLRKKWSDFYKKGDPHYNINLALDYGLFELKK
ncbi:GT2 family glycosyltransferase [Lachnospiraceae bacterium PF1-21]|uniref:glycosyltransferase family 2 protein n=1 Tax=Ohessyouella blattaphilus TaxID=2949333 RepID=UPI003E249AA7